MRRIILVVTVAVAVNHSEAGTGSEAFAEVGSCSATALNGEVESCP